MTLCYNAESQYPEKYFLLNVHRFGEEMRPVKLTTKVFGMLIKLNITIIEFVSFYFSNSLEPNRKFNKLDGFF